MTDQELLELAAKAAGYCLGEGSQGYRTFRCKGGVEWNPKDDDGDSFRLACDCFIDIQFGSGYVLAAGPQGNAVEELKGNDRRPATRMAVLRAAAEIGKVIA